MVDSANSIWRDFITDGVPASGLHEVLKAKIREWGTAVETGEVGGASIITAPPWNGARQYNAGNQVNYEGSIYTALADNLNKVPPVSAEWYLAVGKQGKIKAPTGTAIEAGFNVGVDGVAPTAPIEGDIWKTGGKLYARVSSSLTQEILTGNSGLASGQIIDAVQANDVTVRPFTGATSVIPLDTTAPLITEGAQLLTVNYTPHAATGWIEIDVSMMVTKNSTNFTTGYVGVAVFENNTFIGGSGARVMAAFAPVPIAFSLPRRAAGNTTVRTYSVRVGQDLSAETLLVNGNTGFNFANGLPSMIRIQERVA